MSGLSSEVFNYLITGIALAVFAVLMFTLFFATGADGIPVVVKFFTTLFFR